MPGVMYLELSKVIWEFVKPILSDSMKERLKLKPSAERAEDRVFGFYRSLRLLNECSLTFVLALENFAESPSEEPAKMLDAAARALVRAMEGFQKNQENLEPQLDIFVPRADAFSNFVGSRKLIRDTAAYIAAQTLSDARSADPEELKKLIASAKENHQHLSSAIEDFRAFVAAEFSFKESF